MGGMVGSRVRRYESAYLVIAPEWLISYRRISTRFQPGFRVFDTDEQNPRTGICHACRDSTASASSRLAGEQISIGERFGVPWSGYLAKTMTMGSGISYRADLDHGAHEARVRQTCNFARSLRPVARP